MMVGEALAWAENMLGEAGDVEAHRKVRLLMQHVLSMDHGSLIAAGKDVVEPNDLARFQQFAKRALNEPVHRIMGFREFHGLVLALHEETLEPRDDTETAVELVVDLCRKCEMMAPRFADLGTGTGAIGLALLKDLPGARAVLSDVVPAALETASYNASKAGLANRCTFVEGSWTDPLQGDFDFIVSNPPYISTAAMRTLDDSVLRYDPHLALSGGEDGLDAYRTILTQAGAHLKPSGFLVLEIGFDQASLVSRLAVDTGWRVLALRQDLAGHDRALALVQADDS